MHVSLVADRLADDAGCAGVSDRGSRHHNIGKLFVFIAKIRALRRAVPGASRYAYGAVAPIGLGHRAARVVRAGRERVTARAEDLRPNVLNGFEAVGRTRFDNDNRGGNAYRTLSFHDVDGSVTGIPNSQVLLHDGENDSVATDDTCKIQPTWNAAVCTGDIGRLNLSDARGELPKAVNLESRTARFALLGSIGGGAASNDPLAQAQRTALFSRRAPQPPISLIRNGKEFKISGDQSTVKAGTEIKVKTERTQVDLSLAEMDQGSWVIFELPGFTTATSGKQQDSMDALRKARETSYFKDKDALWVKLVADAPVRPIIRPTDLQTRISVSR